MKNVAIVIPTYNESGNIRSLIARIDAVFNEQHEYAYGILFVDDTSPDGTGYIIRKIQETNDRVRLLSCRREGIGRAYMRGLSKVLRTHTFEYVVTMDADLSHDPKDIIRLLRRLDDGADFVIGSRYIEEGHTEEGYPVHRKLQSFAANRIASLGMPESLHLRDMTSGFRAIRVSALKAVPLSDIRSNGYVFQVDLLHEIARRGFSIREVPITFHRRQYGKSKLRIKDMVEFMRRSLTFRESRIIRLVHSRTHSKNDIPLAEIKI